MKLTDILREIEDEEGGDKGQEFNVPKNMTLSSTSIPVSKLEDYLSDSSNYGMYSRNLQNVGSSALQAKIEQEKAKIFGPTGKNLKDRTPPAKVAKAKELWDAADAAWRKDKAKDIKSRFPEFDINGWEELEFDKLPKEAKKYNVFWDFITGPKLDALIKKVTAEFSTTENPLNWKEEDGRLVFPPDTNPNFNQITKIVNAVMKNAGVSEDEYTLKPEAIKGSNLPKPTTTTPTPEAPKATFKITLDPKKIRGNTEPVKNMIAGLKNTYDKNFDYSKNVLTITNIKPEKKIDLIRFFAPYKQTEITENEDFDFERYQMLRRAGIIK